MEPPEAASSPPSSSPLTAIAASATAAAASPSPSPSSSSGELPSSSSSSLPAAASSSFSDGARISSSSSALAREAASLFQSRHYQECLDVLQQLLLQKEEENPKVLHNIAVVEYLHEGGTDPQKLLNVLSVVKRRNEELSRNISEQLDGINSSSPSSANPSGTKGSNSMASAAGPSPDTIASTEDFDTSISTFNTAVILYHLQQYAAALSMLEPLYQNIEPIDEPAALGICLLILDITLLSCQLRKAADVFQYMERVFGLGFLSTPSESSNLVPSHLVPSSATDSASNVGNTSVTVNSPVASTIPEPSLTRSSSEEVLDEEVLSLSLDMEGSNLGKLAGPLSMLTNSTRISLERPPPVLLKDSNVKILLHLYKVRLLLCSHNIRAAKREVKLAMNLARGHDYLTALNLKAQVEYSRGNHRKAVKLLMTCNNREPGMRCIFLNNLGCIHHHLRKDHAAYFYFVKAFQSCASAALEKPLKLSTYSQDKSLFILYNCGLQQLRNDNPLLAARCFQEAGSLFHNQPFYWLRLAECCILALEKGLLEAGGYHASIKKDELRVSSVGDGEWRKVVLPSGSLNPTLLSTSSGLKSQDAAYGGAPTLSSSHSSSPLVNGTDYFPPGKSHKLSLVFARHCLQNVVHLLNRLDARAVADADPRKSEGDFSQSIQKGGSSMGGTVVGQQCSLNGNNKESKGGSTNTVSTSVFAFEDEKRKHNKSIFLYVLADIAFVELCLENPVRALRSAQKLLLQPECTKAFKFLGHMYAAEALCLLSRPREALNHLATCMIESSSVEIPHNGGDEDGHRWKSGENSEASGEGDDGGSIVAGNSLLGSLPEALNISSLTGIRARASLFVNLAMVHIMQGDLSQAHQFAMQAVSITPANPLAVLSVVYVELVQGRTREAVALLKHCRHLCVLSSKLGC